MKPLILLPGIAILFASCAKDDAIAPKVAAGKSQASQVVVSARTDGFYHDVAGKAPSNGIAVTERTDGYYLDVAGRTQSNEAVAASNASDRAVQRCDAAIHELLDKKWSLQALDGQQLIVPAGARRPWLELSDAHGYRLDGFGGCNSLVGSFVPGCGAILFTNLARTHIYCPATYAQEDQFLAVLGAVDAFAIEGNELILLAGGEEAARFSSHNWSDIPAMQNDISADPPARTPPTVPELID